VVSPPVRLWIGIVGPSPIDESFLARFVFLAENHVLSAAPALVKIAEPAVLVAIRMGLFILFPEQLPGNMFALLALLVEQCEVW
jgi:cellobiose-specific phosphotransferase system component IIC